MNEQFNIEKKEDISKSIDLWLKDLEVKNSPSLQLTRISELFSNMDSENTQLFTNKLNEICFEDNWIKEKWLDFKATLDNLINVLDKQTV